MDGIRLRKKILSSELLLERLEMRSFSVLFQCLFVVVPRAKRNKRNGPSKEISRSPSYLSTMQMMSVPSLAVRIEE